jgi:hypothetical protein
MQPSSLPFSVCGCTSSLHAVVRALRACLLAQYADLQGTYATRPSSEDTLMSCPCFLSMK